MNENLGASGYRLALIGEGLAWLTLAVAVPAVVWRCMDRGRFASLLPEEAVAMGPISNPAWGLGCSVMLIMLALFVWLMVELALLFRSFRKGDWFGPSVEWRLHRLGCAGLFSAAGSLIRPTLLSALVTLGNPPGKRVVVASIDTNDMLGVLIAIFFLLFVQIIRKARKVEDEIKGFV